MQSLSITLTFDMKKNIKILALSLSIAFSFPTLTMAQFQPSEMKETQNVENDDRGLSRDEAISFAYILSKMQHDYVDEIPRKDFFKIAVDGMLSKLDAHTSYMDPDETKKFNEEMEQDYAGIGVTVGLPPPGKFGLKIEEIYAGGPADKAGIKSGDLVKEVDGHVLNKNLDENIKFVKGAVGVKSKLLIDRDGNDIELVTNREKIVSPSVFGDFCECNGAKTYFLRILGFHSNSGSEVADLLLKAATLKPSSIIIDLRDNGGGSLNASVEIASLFLPTNAVVVSSRERGSPERFFGVFSADAQLRIKNQSQLSESLRRSFEVTRKKLLKSWPEMATIPVYVMVNAGSASASEIVAAALKEQHRALIVGEKTFGKGSVQAVNPLPNGGSLRLTIARYYTPSGRSIQSVGVIPDVEVVDSRPWRVAALERNKERYLKKIPDSFLREVDLPRHLGESFLNLDEQTAKYEKEIAEQFNDNRPKASEPYEKRFSYSPLRHDGTPDSLTAKTLDLAIRHITSDVQKSVIK